MDSRPFDDDVTRHPPPLLAFKLFEFSFDNGAILIEFRCRWRLEAQHEGRLSVRGADQTPSFGEFDPDAIDINGVVVLAEIGGRLFGNAELLIVGAIDA